VPGGVAARPGSVLSWGRGGCVSGQGSSEPTVPSPGGGTR
jgi:hypothetical protein